MNRKIQSPQALLGQIPIDYELKDNVALVELILTDAIWKNSFPFPNYTYSYSEFLRAIAKFPMFCSEV
jgi:hypothetical protein